MLQRSSKKIAIVDQGQVRIAYVFHIGHLSQTFASSIYLVPDGNSRPPSNNPPVANTTVASSASAQALENQNAVVSKPDIQIEVSEAADGNESDDSAMVESPVSEAPQNEDQTPLPE